MLRLEDLAGLLADGDDDADWVLALRAAEGTGRQAANPAFVVDLESRLERPIARRTPGRKPAAVAQPRPL